ncbi:hypothetical protein [Streptomyces sp. NRRL S-340]|uniref:hypothetical protein n=1 Tax=Streptomyces sp. NRRL S-340 TaxID=1463901 RepID=UPI00055AC494|nr:hypothetical protein [Streptomyces sp. NRRL S-340]
MLIRKNLALLAGPAMLGSSLLLLTPAGGAAASPQAAGTPATAATAALAPDGHTSARPAAGLECGRNWPHHQYRKGGVTGAYTAFHLCWDNRYNARIDYSSSYVKDTRTDRHKAYVYVHYQKLIDGHAYWRWSGPEAGAGPQRNKVKHFQWGNSSVTNVRVAVCAGTRAPWQSGRHCKTV